MVDMPEARLFQAVLLQAFLDAAATPSPTNQGSYHSRASISHARWWLLEGRKDLELVCMYAGIDAQMVRTAAKRMLRDKWPPLAHKSRYERRPRTEATLNP